MDALVDREGVYDTNFKSMDVALALAALIVFAWHCERELPSGESELPSGYRCPMALCNYIEMAQVDIEHGYLKMENES